MTQHMVQPVALNCVSAFFYRIRHRELLAADPEM